MKTLWLSLVTVALVAAQDDKQDKTCDGSSCHKNKVCIQIVKPCPTCKDGNAVCSCAAHCKKCAEEKGVCAYCGKPLLKACPHQHITRTGFCAECGDPFRCCNECAFCAKILKCGKCGLDYGVPSQIVVGTLSKNKIGSTEVIVGKGLQGEGKRVEARCLKHGDKLVAIGLDELEPESTDLVVKFRGEKTVCLMEHVHCWRVARIEASGTAERVLSTEDMTSPQATIRLRKNRQAKCKYLLEVRLPDHDDKARQSPSFAFDDGKWDVQSPAEVELK